MYPDPQVTAARWLLSSDAENRYKLPCALTTAAGLEAKHALLTSPADAGHQDRQGMQTRGSNARAPGFDCIRSRAKLWSGTSCKRPGAAGKRAPGSQTVPAGATQRRGQHQTSPRLPQLRPWTHRHLELPASARPDVTAPQQPLLRQRPSCRRQLSLHRQRRRGPPAASRPPAYHLRRSLGRLLGLSN